MKIGDRVVLLERVEMYKITYEIGHQFTIVGDDNMRGCLNLQKLFFILNLEYQQI